MKQLTLKLVLPLTIISFVVFTKWWYVAIDGFDEILIGFPLPYICPCWHTSLCSQIFVSGLLIDLLTYFTFWLILTFAINQFVEKIKLNKAISISLLSLSGLFAVCMILIGSLSDNIYTWDMEFEINELETGYKFIWEEKIRR